MKVRLKINDQGRLNDGVDLFYEDFTKSDFNSAILFCTNKNQKQLLNNSPADRVLTSDTASLTFKAKDVLYLKPYGNALFAEFNGKTLVVVSYQELVNFTTNNVFEKYKGKIIKFIYNGGSHPGSFRTVKVEEVANGFITGFDVGATFATGNNKLEFRKYVTKNITGAIQEITL